MSVNQPGAIGYEAFTDVKGRVTVTYQGKTTTYKNYKEYVEKFKNPYDAKHPKVVDQKGTTVQPNPDNKKLTPEQQQAKAKAQAAAQQEIANAKAQAAAQQKAAPAPTPEDKAKAKVQKDGVKTEDGVITSHGNGTTYTFDIKAPTKHKEKVTKDQERARLARYYDEKTGEWIERGDKLKTNKDVRKALRAKEKEIKAEAKSAKKEAKALNKAAQKARNEFNKVEAEIEKLLAEGHTLEELESDPKYDKLWQRRAQALVDANEYEIKSNEASDRHMKAREEREQVHQAHTASKRTNFLRKTGVGADKRAHNQNVDAQNRLADRVVVRTEAEKARIKDAPEMKGKEIKVASSDDIQVLKSLSSLARKYMDEASDPKEKAVWQELASLTKKTDNGRLYFNASTKQVQDALIDLTGGDMRLNYTEQKMIAKETGMSMSQIRSAFKTYGFEAPNPLGKRVVNGLKEAAPVAATMGLSYLLSKNKAHAEDYAEDTKTATATADATATETATATATAVADTKGYKIDWVSPDNSMEVHKRFAGQHDEQTAVATAVATATAHAEAKATAFATATAACEAVAVLKPAALYAAPLLAFLAGATKVPVEISAAQAGATTEKMSKFVNVFKHNKNKNIGNQIIQMAGHITGNKAVDRALIVAVLNNDIGAQNTNPTLRELRNALAHLDAIKKEVDRFKNLPSEQTQQNQQNQSVQQNQQNQPAKPKEYCYDVKPGDKVKPNTHTVAAGDTVDMIIKAKYPDSNFAKAKAAFLKANPALKDPNSIQPGQEFVLPNVDGKAPKLNGEVRKARGGKRIVFRPSKMPGINGEQMYDVFDCSDPKNEKKLNQRPLTQQDAKAEQARLSEEAQRQGRVPRK